MGKKLFMIRHSEIDPAYGGRYVGHTDVACSPAGKEKARTLGKVCRLQLPSSAAFLSSPFLRCRQTWEELGLEGPISWEENLREVDFGRWEGKSFKEICEDDLEAVASWGRFDLDFRFPGGESLREFTARMERVKKLIMEHPAKHVTLITHGGVVCTLLCLFLGLPPSQYMMFSPARPSLTTMNLFQNGKGVLTGISGPSEGRGEWPGLA